MLEQWPPIQSLYSFFLPSHLLCYFHIYLDPFFVVFACLLCFCSSTSLSHYQKVTEWFHSTAQKHSAKGQEQLFRFKRMLVIS